LIPLFGETMHYYINSYQNLVYGFLAFIRAFIIHGYSVWLPCWKCDRQLHKTW